MTSSLFKGTSISAFYAQFRPNSPKEFIDRIVAQGPAKIGQGGQAADIGCGSGQCTELLAPHYEKVYGFDVSADQIENAIAKNKFGHVSYKVSPAEIIPLADQSLDAITSAQAFHWFDKERFFKEADRLLKPSGVLALITYEVPKVVYQDSVELSDLVWDVCQHPYLMPYWAKNVQLVNEGYASIVLPYKNSTRVQHTVTQENISGEDLLGYIKSWSGWNTLEKLDSSKTEQIVEKFKEKVRSVTGMELNAKVFSAEYKFHMLIANKD